MARKPVKSKKSKSLKGDTVVILPAIHNECLSLLAEAHDHFFQHGEEEQTHLNERDRIMYASEMSRITIRLSCVMAWLMTRKAVFSGKLTEKEAGEKYRLDCRDVCLNQHIQAEAILPKKVKQLLDKSFDLYQRVARLDDMADKEKHII